MPNTRRAKLFTPEAGLIGQKEFLTILSETPLPIIANTKKQNYYNVPAAFDIEVSSFYQDGEKRACMYVWQFGILNWVTYGRTWEEYLSFIEELSEILNLSSETRLIVYIHNMAYEFQFMRKWFQWDKLFFLEERRPVYGLVGGIEYRCSLKLSGKSLANVGKDLQKYKVNKLTGDLDYNLVRTSETPLTEKELGYCENDIRVLLAYIQEKIESDGNIARIPLTNTGYVRNYCRKECFKRYKRYHNLMSELTLDPDEYDQLKRGFQGGFTHASARKSGKVYENVASFDFTSSYPAVMLSEKFPMSKATRIKSIGSQVELEGYLNEYCCLFDATFTNIVPRFPYEHPLSASKCIEKVNAVVDNGRISSAESVTVTITEQDFFVYQSFYTWEHLKIHNFLIYEKSYLPKNFYKAILELYRRKTVLKDVEGEEIDYMISKGMLNSAYGMCVTDIVRDAIEYEGDAFKTTKADVKEAIKIYNNAVKRFLFYPWGVWVTAYSRRNLFTGILACGEDYIYSDTDSIKILNPDKHMDYIESYNKRITEKLKEAAKFHLIDASELAPKNIKGVEKPIGVWEYEGTYDRFKTLGAKRYLVQKGDKYFLTVAGLNKAMARDYIVANWKDPFDALEDGLIVPPEASGRLTLTYIDEETDGVVVDYLGQASEYHEKSCVHMEPSEYTLSLSSEYTAFLNLIHGIKDVSW